MAFGRLEARITVPAGGWDGTIDDSGGGGSVAWSVPAGTYYLPELLAELEDRLNTAAPTDTLTVSVGNGENGSGKVTIASGGGTFAVVWIDVDLRDLLGYAGNLSGSNSYPAPNHARSHWIAQSPYKAPNEVYPWGGWPVADFRTVESASGLVWAFTGQKKEIARLEWEAVPRARASKANEGTANESFQRLVEDGVWGFAPWGTPGGPVRFFPDADEVNYARYYCTDLQAFEPQQFADGWAGGPWRVQLPRLVLIETGQAGEGGGASRATIAVALLTAASSTTDGTSIVTASISPAGNRAIYAGIVTSTGAGPVAPTVAGNGLTWVQVTTVTFSSNTRRLTVFRAMGGSPSAGTVTFSFGGQTQTSFVWSIIECDEVDTSGTSASGATVQSATNSTASGVNLSVSFGGALEHVNNVALVFVALDISSTVTPDADFTEISDTNISPNSTLEAEWADGETSCTATFATASAGIVAVEVKSGPP
jgi:hypothetical protein